MSARSPKGLKTMIAASQEDTDSMQSKLSKLKRLQDDDKNENAMLRSRIDEQSQLIMMLKKRTDESIVKIQTLTRINDELQQFRDGANGKLENELRRFDLLEKHFEELAYNHNEIIKFKDEYKRQNEVLRAENEKLKDDNTKLFSKAIEEKNEQIKELQKTLGSYKERYLLSTAKQKSIEDEHEKICIQHRDDIKAITVKFNESEEKLKAAQSRLGQLTQHSDTLGKEQQNKILLLNKEKDQLLELSMQRGRLIQEKQAQNKDLQQKIEDTQKKLNRMKEKFDEDYASVNANVQVRRLRSQVEEADERTEDIIKQFDAYKKHSGALLRKEKELNERLRILT